MAEFPFSDSKLIDESQPNDATLGTALDDSVRENRRALNYVWGRATIRHSRRVDLVPLVQSLSVQGDKILLLAISETPHTLVQLTGGYEGQIIYLLLEETTPGDQVILHHNSQYIALTDGRDLALQPGDLICLRNVGGDLEASVNGRWVEVFREVAGAIMGLISPGGDRFELGVSDQGAVTVREL